MSSLHEARARAAHAGHHIRTLRSELAAFLTPACFELILRRDERAGRNSLRAVLTRSVPDIIPAIIGDIVHNARAALDMALARLVGQRLGHTPRHIRFPFHSCREGVLLACRSEGLRELGEAPLHAVLEHIRPYQGGDDFLYALHELDILDRHSALMPRISIVELRNMQFEDSRRTIAFRISALLDQGGQVHKPLLAAAGRLRLIDPGQAVFAVGLPPGGPLAGAPLLPALVECVRRVQSGIARLEESAGTPFR